MLAQTIQLALDAALTRNRRALEQWEISLDMGASESEFGALYDRSRLYRDICDHLEAALELLGEAEPKV